MTEIDFLLESSSKVEEGRLGEREREREREREEKTPSLSLYVDLKKQRNERKSNREIDFPLIDLGLLSLSVYILLQCRRTYYMRAMLL